MATTKKNNIHGPRVSRSNGYVLERIKSRCEYCDACGSDWSWTGSKNDMSGQYQVHFGGIVMNVRRALMIALGNKMIAGRGVQTKCVNPRCINPELTKQRSYSAMSKGFTVSAATKAKISAAKAVIPMGIVEAIRVDPRPASIAAHEYGVSKSSYEELRAGRRRKLYGNPFAGLGAR